MMVHISNTYRYISTIEVINIYQNNQRRAEGVCIHPPGKNKVVGQFPMGSTPYNPP